jgi:hypothetical protein
MKLLRHFLAVSTAVGLVVALGVVWSASGAASIVADNKGGRQPESVPSGTSFALREIDRRGAGGFSLSNASDLVQTLIILALITVAVVVIDRTRRRHRHRQFPVGRSSIST